MLLFLAASKWEEESEDGQMPQDLRMKDSAMLSDSGHTGSNTNPSEEVASSRRLIPHWGFLLESVIGNARVLQ